MTGQIPKERPGQTTRLEQTRSSAAASPAPRTPARWDRGGPAEPRERDLHGVRLAQVLRDRRVNLSRNPERGEARFPECVEDGAVRIRLAQRGAEIAYDRDGFNLEAEQFLTEQALQRIDGASDRANGDTSRTRRVINHLPRR